MSGETIVKISTGLLEGTIKKDLNGKPFYSFEGIPYGVPPVGNLRFKAPIPIGPWQGVRKATSKGPTSAFSCPLPKETGSEKNSTLYGEEEAQKFYEICSPSKPWISKPIGKEVLQLRKNLQNNEKIFLSRMNLVIGGSEDSLYLNVFTPSLPSNSVGLKPVMVYFHGGGFLIGCPHAFGPEVIVSEDTILVTVAYRLGVLGFLSIDDPKLGATGNAGMKDMVLSLKWVQENIKAFNGDPNNVTIFGQSAGGASTDYLVLSPATKGLIHKAIIQSGSSFCYWARGYNNRESEVAKCFGSPSCNKEELLKFLQNMPLEDLIERGSMLEDGIIASSQRYFAPVVEHPDTKDAFLTENPIDILNSGRYQHIPLITGYSNDEGMLFSLPMFGFNTTENAIVPNFLNLKIGSEGNLKVAREIIKFYSKGNALYTEGGILNENGKKLAGDIAINIPIFQCTKHYLKKNKNPVYIYRVSASTKLCTITKGTYKGVCHADDFGYLFLMADSPEVTPGSVEDITRKRMSRLFTNFAKNGNPNPEKQDKLFSTVWRPVQDASNMRLLEIGEELSMVDKPEEEYIEFWEQIFKDNGYSV